MHTLRRSRFVIGSGIFAKACSIGVLGAVLSSDPVVAETYTNTVVRFEIDRGTNTLGMMDVELFDKEKPLTVQNFLLYVRSGAYTNGFLHRCVPGFVVQGGGYSVTNPLSSARFASYFITTNYGRLTNEYQTGPRISNTAGTLAMAKVGNDPDSATCQWFFNLQDNSETLDSQNGGFTVFGRVIESTNSGEGLSVLEHFNTLATNAGVIDLALLLGSSYEPFNTLPVSYTNSGTRAPQYRELYYARVRVLNDTIPPGQTPPTLTVFSPTSNACFTNGAVVISGAADDDTGIARVVYRLENGTAEAAQGTTNWVISLFPQPGFNTVTIESIDWDGNRSATASVPFYYERTIPLAVEVTGKGSITGVYDGEQLTVGRSYTAKALAGEGYVFGTWGGSVTSSTPNVTFQVATNATNFILTAKFIPNPLPNLAGTYNGLFQPLGTPTLESAGFMTLLLQGDGVFEGSIKYQGTLYNFTGKFNSAGGAIISGSLGGINRQITLQLQRTSTEGLITGTFSGTDSTTFLRLERTANSLKGTNVPPAGRYTFLLPNAATNQPTQNVPGGNGFGTAVLSTNGTFTFSGTLADGTSFTSSPAMTRFRRWPLYKTLASGKGVLLGWITPASNSVEQLEGTLQWIRKANATAKTYPGGFSNQITLTGSRYQQPGSGVRVANWAYGLARLTGTDLVPSVTNLLKLTLDNSLEMMQPVSAGLDLQFDLVTGEVAGSFVHPLFQTTHYLSGALLAGSNVIRGQYIHGKEVGRLDIEATPFLVTQAVTSVTAAGVAAAIQDGGLLRFEGDGVVQLESTLRPQYDTVLDANGHSVGFTGGSQMRLVEVQTNKTFGALGVVFADGAVSGSAGANGSSPEAGQDALGAGILNLGGVVVLTNCIITNCVVTGGQAGVATGAATNWTGGGGRALGAAICNLGGKLTLQSCAVVDNAATGGPGGRISSAMFNFEEPGWSAGAGLFSQGGECRIYDSTFLRNRVEGAAPLQFSNGEWSRAGDAAGGALAVLAGSARLSNSRVLSNVVSIAAGPGSGSGNSYGAGVFVHTNVTMIIDGVKLGSNEAMGAELREAATGAEAHGGAIFTAGTLVVSNSAVEFNRAVAGVGSSGSTARGGGLAASGMLVINATTFSDNLAQGGELQGSATAAFPGGAAFGGALFATNGSVVLTNSTFAQNKALGGAGSGPAADSLGRAGDGLGGALFVCSNSVVLVNLTLGTNTAVAGPNGNGGGTAIGGALAQLGSTVKLMNSILSGNAPENISGTLTDWGYNFSSDSSAALKGSGSATNAELFLQPLANNGGPTLTMAITASSPARDAVRGKFPPFDQRGTIRPQGSYADSGAVEFVQTLPIFSIQPFGTNYVRLGTNFTFQSLASGPGVVGYYWLKNSEQVPGATNRNLTLTNIQTADEGLYGVVATNSYGAVTSTVSTLIVDLRPLILIQPSDLLLSPGGTASLFVNASGPSLSYQWFQDNVAVPFATNPALTITNARPAAKGYYHVIVSNYAGTVTSRLANVSFNSAALAILSQPESVTAAEGGPTGFSVLASGIMPIDYQWTLGGITISGWTNNTVHFAAASRTNAGVYRVVVKNDYLALTSSPAILTVVAQPRLSVSSRATNVLITCYGDAGQPHRLTAATNIGLPSNWTAVATNTMPASGSITWTQSVSAGSLFFRAVTP